jgi:hypothetical protein
VIAAAALVAAKDRILDFAKHSLQIVNRKNAMANTRLVLEDGIRTRVIGKKLGAHEQPNCFDLASENNDQDLVQISLPKVPVITCVHLLLFAFVVCTLAGVLAPLVYVAPEMVAPAQFRDTTRPNGDPAEIHLLLGLGVNNGPRPVLGPERSILFAGA